MRNTKLGTVPEDIDPDVLELALALAKVIRRPEPPKDERLTIGEAAARSKKTPRAIRDAIRNGQLVGELGKLGGCSAAALHAWLASRCHVPAPPESGDLTIDDEVRVSLERAARRVRGGGR